MFSLKVLLLCVCTIQVCLGLGIQTFQIGYYDVQNLEACENEAGTLLNLEVIKEGDKKWVQGNITTDFDFNSEVLYKYQLDRWSGTEWKNGYMKFDGKACDGLEKVMKKAFHKLIDSLEPKVATKECNIPKGTYVIKNYQAAASDMDLPPMVFGKYRSQVEFYKGEQLVGCLKTLAEAKT